jgi:hypothetical protein
MTSASSDELEFGVKKSVVSTGCRVLLSGKFENESE